MGNSSCWTRIVGDIAARRTTSSISKRALRSAFSIRSRVATSTVVLTGSCSSGLIRRFIQGSTTRAVAGEHDRRRVVLLDDRVAVDLHARLERGARVRRDVDDPSGVQTCWVPVRADEASLAAVGARLELRDGHAADGDDAQVHDLGTAFEHEPVEEAVGFAEAALERCEVERGELVPVQLDRDLVALAAVAHVEDEADVLVGGVDALLVEPVARAGRERLEAARGRRPASSAAMLLTNVWLNSFLIVGGDEARAPRGRRTPPARSPGSSRGSSRARSRAGRRRRRTRRARTRSACGLAGP